MIADIPVEANEFPLAAIPLALTGCNLVILEPLLSSKSLKFHKAHTSFFFPLSRIMLCWGISRCGRSIFVRCKAEFVL
ncbi:MAG: hypothetical protein D3922_16585 [Candidatus Electrothrix sp. AR1]|nr:hypothetical protein [Candidatus Electrothrix sp. AR1]